MANDRIFLRCPVCKDVYRLYSYYPSGNHSSNTHPSLENWIDDHIHDCGQIFDGDLSVKGPFLFLCTESPEVMEYIQKRYRE